jgi:LuxR family maltose regulon positive regulatory protein
LEGNELEQAQHHLETGLHLAEELGPLGGDISAILGLAEVMDAFGDEEGTQAWLQRARQLAIGRPQPFLDERIAVSESVLALSKGNLAAAARWAEETGMAPTDEPDHLREMQYIAYARLLLAQEEYAAADTLLAALERFARSGGRGRSLIKIHILEAIRHHSLDERELALKRMEKALSRAAPEGYRRLFLEEGPPALELLRHLRPVAPQFVDQILGAGAAEAEPMPALGPIQGLADPLSDRELEVLALISDGLSNREIGTRLFISVGTVKTHVHSILGKLGVQSRTQAVARARERDLLLKK